MAVDRRAHVFGPKGRRGEAWLCVGCRRGMVDARGSGAFTLLEILLVLTLIALLGAVLIGGAVSLLRDAREQDPEGAVLSLLQKVRGLAVEQNRVVVLEQAPEGGAFFWGDGESLVLPGAEAPRGAPGAVRARLLRAEFAGASLIGGRIEERPLLRMRFFPDGSCEPARLEVWRGDARRVMVIDPWTAAPLPEPVLGTAGGRLR